MIAETLTSILPVLISEPAGIAVPLVAYLIGVSVQRLFPAFSEQRRGCDVFDGVPHAFHSEHCRLRRPE